jgi:phospholipase/lecithinase/hemolysin
VKSRIQLALAVLVLVSGLLVQPSAFAFTSIHVFGDGLSCTATNPGAGQYYYGKRYSNGRVWVEVLAQMQGLAFNPTNGNPHSYFGNVSSNLLAQTSAYTPPADASNALVVIWVNNADFYYPIAGGTSDLSTWTNIINASQTNHFKAITNLYFSKGIRTLVMPNMVDAAKVPYANASPKTNLYHEQCVKYNTAFNDTLNRARTTCPDLTIIVPDYYSLLNDLLTNPAPYGVTNALYNNRSIDVLDDPALNDKSLNGRGTNYIFWDYTDPTAKVHYIMAATAQRLISPARIGGVAVLDVSNRVDMVNLPVGMNGLVEGCTNLLPANWTTIASFTATGAVQSVFVPAPVTTTNMSRPSAQEFTLPEGRIPELKLLQFYRLQFPVNYWVWP